jgi:hypothetical protein
MGSMKQSNAGVVSLLQANLLQYCDEARCERVKATPRDGTTAQLFSLDQPDSLKLLNSGRHPAWAALATGTAWRGNTAFRIFCWLEVADFDLVFLFLLPCLVLHVAFHLFVVCACVDRLAGTGGASVQLARRPPVGIRGRLTAFRIFWWLKVREFDLFFLFLFLGLVLHGSFHLFVVFVV